MLGGDIKCGLVCSSHDSYHWFYLKGKYVTFATFLKQTIQMIATGTLDFIGLGILTISILISWIHTHTHYKKCALIVSVSK